MKSKQENDKIESLRQTLIQGEQRGMAENFDRQALLDKVAGSGEGEETGDELNAMIRYSRYDNPREIELSDLEDIQLYDEAKKEDDGKRMLFSDYIRTRGIKRC